MKRCIPKRLATLFIAVIAVVFAGPAAAHGNRHGDRITLTWLVEGVSDVFEVKAPVNPPLRYIKKYFMLKSGLPVRHASHYVIEQVVTTSAPTTIPGVPVRPGAQPVNPTQPVTDYVLLDDTRSLKDLGIVDGDTLRIREVADHDLGESHHTHRSEHGDHTFARYDRDGRRHDGDRHERRRHR